MGASRGLKRKKPLRVVVVSERRADYARFKPILTLMKEDPFFDYYLIVTGISLLKRYGEDIKIIKSDGFKIHSVIPMYKEGSPDNGAEMTRAYGRVMTKLADLFENIKPDLILSGFDIGANLSATIVGAHMNIHVAHIQGGEITGSIDEPIRHAMSKFAHIHFPATKEAASRLKQMGEDQRFIFTVGCPSIDTLLQAPITPREEIVKMLGFNHRDPYILIVQHPVTTEVDKVGWQISQTLSAVKALNLQGVILYPNNDAGSRAIIQAIKNSRISFIRSLPPDTFTNVLRYASALVGNSSSGIHETATLGVPTVNIGSRQQGRERAKNVVDVGYQKTEIIRGIKKALYDKKFRQISLRSKNIYGDGQSAKRIVKVLKTINLVKVPIQKRFIDY